MFGSTLKILFFSKHIMTSPRLPLVNTQRSFLSGIRLSRELHEPTAKVILPPIKLEAQPTEPVLSIAHLTIE